MTSRADVLISYLDFFRARVIEQVTALPEQERRASRLPSRWTPLELVRHLTFVERRWLMWRFLGQEMESPWDDERYGRWFVEEESLPTLRGLADQGTHTRRIARAHDLQDLGAPGPGWDGSTPASLERVLLHLIQEYARHLGHLDVVIELAVGDVGE